MNPFLDAALRHRPPEPKAEARAIRHGFPWVYAGELVMDRRTSALLPGALRGARGRRAAADGRRDGQPRARRSSRG